jgi:PAS domain-containing protein
MIIGVCGLIGAGKDTIADYLVNIHEFRRDSFAATLKDAVAAVFGWDRDMLEGRSRSSREWREQPDAWWSDRLGQEVTPRLMLQLWGTEVCRRGFHDDVWIASLENKLRNSADDVVISDCRFPNEIAAIHAQNGYVIRVVRGADPAWFQPAQQHLIEGTPRPADLPHQSEWAWAGTRFDRVVDNNGSMDDLYQQITDLVQDLRAARADPGA